MQENQKDNYSDKRKLIEYAIGPGTYEIINGILSLMGFDENWSITNLKDYVDDAMVGDFKISDDTNIHFQFYEDNIHCKLNFVSNKGKTSINFDDKFNVTYSDYREMLDNGSLLHYEFDHEGRKITELFGSNICKMGQINLDSDLTDLKSNGFMPDYSKYKSKLFRGFNNKQYLEDLDDLKDLKNSSLIVEEVKTNARR